jgi:neutral ceramidase
MGGVWFPWGWGNRVEVEAGGDRGPRHWGGGTKSLNVGRGATMVWKLEIMKWIGRSILRAVVGMVGLCVIMGCGQPAATRSPGGAGLRVGAAEIDITPPVGHRMAGYFDERLATGVHDPLHAKAIVIEQGSRRMALVSCDLVGVSLTVTTNARAAASRLTGIPESNIVICATHTHTGPLFDDVRRYYFHAAALARFGKDPQEEVYYPDFLIERLTNVIVAAQRELRPAELSAGTTQATGLTFNRRYVMKNGKVRFNPGRLNPEVVRPAGPKDETVGMLLARRPGAAEPFVGLTTFAVHSDTVGGTQYSADYEYFLERTLRRGFGSNFISAFGLGTCGDLNHIDVDHEDTLKGYERAEHIGTTLGEAVVKSAPELRPIRRPSLAVRSETLTVPLQEYTPEELAAAKGMVDKLGDPKTDFFAKVAAVKILDLAQRGPVCRMEVQAFRLDEETAMVCLPCELFVELGLAIKAGSPFRNTFVIEICNDRPSYVPTRKAFAEGSYEISNARVKPEAGEMLVEAATRLLREVKGAGG